MCTRENPCGGVLTEDVTTTRDLESTGIKNRKIFSCLNAHHFIAGKPAGKRKKKEDDE